MSEEEDCEIEFLDEDAEIVQKCVQNVDEAMPIEPIQETVTAAPPKLETALLVERTPNERSSRKKRKKIEEEDSDYDPTDDLARSRKKRPTLARPTPSRNRQPASSRSIQIHIPKTEVNVQIKKQDPYLLLLSANRKRLDIRIPDYEDPLCLPVRAVINDEVDHRKLRYWNKLSLENFKQFDIPLRADKKETVSSKRTVVLRNLHNKMTGKIETMMYSKVCVETQNKEKKAEVVQAVLPKYREKKILNRYKLTENKKRKTFHHKEEILLTKETNKDVENLIVYKPKENLSLVYKMFEKKPDIDDKDDDDKKYLKEVASCKVCAPCYQTSWRGFKQTEKKNIHCQICKRPCISVYNLLAHLRSHSEADVRAHRRAIARSLASTVEYHYKCRICQEQFLSIKELRAHVSKHKGTEPFLCEVGNHTTT